MTKSHYRKRLLESDLENPKPIMQANAVFMQRNTDAHRETKAVLMFSFRLYRSVTGSQTGF